MDSFIKKRQDIKELEEIVNKHTLSSQEGTKLINLSKIYGCKIEEVFGGTIVINNLLGYNFTLVDKEKRGTFNHDPNYFGHNDSDYSCYTRKGCNFSKLIKRFDSV